MAILFTPPWYQPLSGSVATYPNARLYFYQTGTTTLQTVYTDAALSVAHANPVEADVNGYFAPIYLNQAAAAEYKAVLKDSSDNTLQTVDPISAALTDIGSVATVADGSILVAHKDGASTGSFTSGAVATTVAEKFDRLPFDVAADGNAATDGSDAQAQIAAAIASGRVLKFSAGAYGIDTDLAITDTQVWIGDGQEKTTIAGITGDERITINGGSLFVVGIKFNNLGDVAYNTGSIVELNVQDCWFNDVAGIARASAVTNTVTRLVFNRNRVTSCGNGLVCQTNTLSSAEVCFNEISGIASTDVQACGIRLGNDTFEAKAAVINRNNFRVLGNIVDTVDTSDATSSARSFGIATFGDYAQVVGNTVKSITTSGRGLGAEGIYMKGRYRVCNDNTLVDAVESIQGMITLKGDRTVTATSTTGYMSTCIGNACTLTSSGNGGFGIWIQCDDTIVSGNVCEGMKTASAQGITEAGGIGISSSAKGNVIVSENILRDIAGNYGIYCAAEGYNIRIHDNTIDGVTDAEAGASTRGIAITGQTGAVDGLDVCNNRILIDTTDSTTNLVGIYFAQGQANTNIVIDGNTVKLSDATATEAGIQFAGTTAPASNVTITNNDLSQCGASNSEVISFEATKAPTNVRIAGNKWPVFQTTSATTTNIARINLADESAYAIQATVKGAEASTITDRCMYVNHGLVYRTAAGNAAVQGSVNQVTAIEVTAGMDSTIGVTGQGALVTVTGAASTTMNWTLDLTVN